MSQFDIEGLVNIIGCCCDTTPDHIAAIGQTVKTDAPRKTGAGFHAEAA